MMTSQNMATLTEATSNLLKALAHPARLLICCTLQDTEMSVGQIEESLNIKQPRLSRELAKLREEGLLQTRRESKVIFYTLSENKNIRLMVNAICNVMLGKTAGLPQSAPAKPKAQSIMGCSVFARTWNQEITNS